MPPRSKIAQLPAEMREWLHKALVERAYGDIVALTEELNAKLKEGGIAVYVGKSAVGAESQKVQRAQEAIKATTDAAKLLTETSRDDGNLRGEAVMAMVESEMFQTMMDLREAEAEQDPFARMEAMSKAAKNIAALSRARVNQSKFRLEIEARVKAAADKVDKLAKKGGLSSQTAAEIRRTILGIKDTPKPGSDGPQAA